MCGVSRATFTHSNGRAQHMHTRTSSYTGLNTTRHTQCACPSSSASADRCGRVDGADVEPASCTFYVEHSRTGDDKNWSRVKTRATMISFFDFPRTSHASQVPHSHRAVVSGGGGDVRSTLIKRDICTAIKKNQKKTKCDEYEKTPASLYAREPRVRLACASSTPPAARCIARVSHSCTPDGYRKEGGRFDRDGKG